MIPYQCKFAALLVLSLLLGGAAIFGAAPPAGGTLGFLDPSGRAIQVFTSFTPANDDAPSRDPDESTSGPEGLSSASSPDPPSTFEGSKRRHSRRRAPIGGLSSPARPSTALDSLSGLTQRSTWLYGAFVLPQFMVVRLVHHLHSPTLRAVGYTSLYTYSIVPFRTATTAASLTFTYITNSTLPSFPLVSHYALHSLNIGLSIFSPPGATLRLHRAPFDEEVLSVCGERVQLLMQMVTSVVTGLFVVAGWLGNHSLVSAWNALSGRTESGGGEPAASAQDRDSSECTLSRTSHSLSPQIPNPDFLFR